LGIQLINSVKNVKANDNFKEFHACKNTELFYSSFLEFSISKFILAYRIPLPLHFSEE